MMEEAQQGRGVSDSLAVEHMLARSLLLAPIICSALTGWPENRSLAFRAARALDDEPNEETREDRALVRDRTNLNKKRSVVKAEQERG